METIWVVAGAAGGAVLTLFTTLATTWFQQRHERWKIEAQHRQDQARMDREHGQRIGEEVRRVYSKCNYHLAALAALLPAFTDASPEYRQQKLAAFSWVARLLLLVETNRDALEVLSSEFFASTRDRNTINKLRTMIVETYITDKRVRY